MYSLLKIDALLRSEHPYLTAQDDCSYFMEYFPKIRDDVNSIIMNFKKTVDRIGKSDYRYKGITIQRIADLFKQTIPHFINEFTILVPIPPSKVKGHPLYDDRVVRLLKLFCRNQEHADIREILSANGNLQASHESTQRPTPDEIKQNLQIDVSLCEDKRPNIILVDDVITTGSHFKACKELLQEQFPESNISGLFIARRAII
ncbi:MAG: hypothetical protein ACKVOM_02550 [Ferruginibacter sp.]